MTIFEQTFRQLLIAANLVESRVFLWRAPQAPNTRMVIPYAVFFHVSPWTRDYPHDGPLTLQQRDYQLDIFDESQSRCVAIADSFREYLDGYKGVYQNVRFGAIFFTNQTSAYEDDTRLFHVAQEYRVQYHLSPPVAAAVISSAAAVPPAVPTLAAGGEPTAVTLSTKGP